jgi:L-serine deaminase
MTIASRLIDTADEVSVVVVDTRAGGDADAALTAGAAATATAVARLKPIKQWPARGMMVPLRSWR